MARHGRTWVWAGWLALLAARCGGGGGEPGDVRTDDGAAEIIDASADADADDDADAEAGADADADTGDVVDAAGDAEPDVPADEGGETAGDGGANGDADPCPVARRCRSRVVEACDPATGVFATESVCGRDERCEAAACLPLPEEYGAPCRTAAEVAVCEAAGLECGGVAAIPLCLLTAEVRAVGGECWGLRDCQPGLLCTRTGTCSAGAAGDECLEAEDCAAPLVCGGDGTCGS